MALIQAQRVATARCCECGGEAPLETIDLGPWGAKALLPPLRVLCSPCVNALGLHIYQDGGKPYVLHRGQEFRLVAGQYTRSDHPANAGVYYRDEKSR
jgi:hypothetical protein